MKKKVFLLGVGCQKGGTTWLYDYLKHSPVVNLGFAKEYHVFDALHVESCKAFIDEKLTVLNQLIYKNEVISDREHPHLLKALEFYKNPESYFDYFDYLHQTSSGVEVVGDITPSYSALSSEVFADIKQKLEAKGFTIKVVFLMRDPFERIWSQIRMGRRNDLISNQQHKPINTEESALAKYYKENYVQIRSHYEKTISNLEAVFDTKDIHYEFFECLFKEESITKIEDFLGVPHQNPDLSFKSNSSPKTIDVSEPLKAEVVDYYRDTYEFCMDRFGSAFIKEIWPSTQYL